MAPPTPSSPALTASNCTAPTAIWSTSFCATRPTSAPTAMAAARSTAPLPHRSDRSDRRRMGRRSRRRAARTDQSVQRHRRQQSRRDILRGRQASLTGFGLSYLHIVEPGPTDPVAAGEKPDIRFFRRIWRGTLIGNKSYDLARANAALRDGHRRSGLVRERCSSPIPICPSVSAVARRSIRPTAPTFYAGGEKGYTDYPALAGLAHSRSLSLIRAVNTNVL